MKRRFPSRKSADPKTYFWSCDILNIMEFDKAVDVFSQHETIEAAYLFGSQAAGLARQDSDVDFALYCPKLTDIEIANFKDQILSELTDAGYDKISLIFITFEDLYLAFQAVSQNCLLYGRESFNQNDFYSYVVRRYLDFKPYLDRQRAFFKEEQLGG